MAFRPAPMSDSSEWRASSGARRNVLLLIIDDLRSDLGCFGRRWSRSPSIDALSSRSSTFLQAHSQFANCAPSRASLLTGLRPDTHAVYDLTTHVRDRHRRLATLPQVFRQSGYLAISYGKIFHQFLDDDRSWSGQSEFTDNHTYRGLRGRAWSRAGGWSKGWRYNQYMTAPNLAKQAETVRRRREKDFAVSINGLVPPYEIGPDRTEGGESYTDERLASLAVRALRRLRRQPRPWLLAVGFIRPHLPFNAPARFWAQSGAAAEHVPTGSEGPPSEGLSRLTLSHLGGGDGELYDFAHASRHLRAASSEGRDLARAYAAAVSFVDEQVETGGDAAPTACRAHATACPQL